MYEWVKVLHIISVIAWMAGMLYLPRLFVYHADATPGSDKAETFKTMERRLLRAIMTPAMAGTWIFGLWLAWLGDWYFSGWFLAKFALVLALSGMHGALSRWTRDFAADANRRPARFYRMVNEVPTVLLIGIVILVVVKPF
jgi:putative membrane protein